MRNACGARVQITFYNRGRGRYSNPASLKVVADSNAVEELLV